MLKHLRELVADASTCGWELVRGYHAVRRQHFENGWTEWEDTDLKLELHWALVWNSAQCSNPRTQSLSSPRQPPVKDMAPKPVTAKHSTRACALYNQGKCGAQADHSLDRHICSFCQRLNRACKMNDPEPFMW